MKITLILLIILLNSCSEVDRLERNFVSFKRETTDLDFTKKVIIQQVKDGIYPYHCAEEAIKNGFIFFGETEFSSEQTFWQNISDKDLHELSKKKEADLTLWFVFNNGYLVHYVRDGEIANYVIYSLNKTHYLGFFFKKPEKKLKN